jgi:uncharacterized surface protein with fasciclin (FAS1) repeats
MLNRRRLAQVALSMTGTVLATGTALRAQAQSATLLDVIKGSQGTSRFAEMIRIAGVEAEFTSATRRSAFVPTNAAIEAIPALRMQDLTANPPKMRALVLNHLVDGAAPINLTISDSGSMGSDTFRSRGGAPVSVSFGSGGLPRANGAQIVLANVQAGNGLVHVISTVFES